MMSIAILVAASTLFVFPLPEAFLPVLFIAVLLYFFVAPITPFADSATMSMLGDEREMYGRIRLGGTIGFGMAALVVGIIVQNFGMRLAFWISAAFLLVGFFVSQKMVYSQLSPDQPVRGRVRSLLANPRWILFLVVAFAGGLSLAALNNYLFPTLKELGADESMMGLMVLVGTVSEIPVFFFGNRLLRFFNSYGLLMFSMLVTSLRFLLLGVAVTPGFVLVSQLLNGLTVPATWVAGVAYADENAPPGMSATAQGMFNAMILGIGNAVGGFIGGPLLETLGGSGLYFVFGAAVLVIATVVMVVYKRLPEKGKTPVSIRID
jgi:PPP family 3-phenylpropionic acid transporter